MATAGRQAEVTGKWRGRGQAAPWSLQPVGGSGPVGGPPALPRPSPSPPLLCSLELAGRGLALSLPLSRPPGPWLRQLQGEPRVISVLFRAGRPPPSQLVGLQAARSRREPHARRPHLRAGLGLPAGLQRLPRLPQARSPVSPRWATPPPPSALITATHVQPTAPLPSSDTSPFSFSLSQAYSPGPGVHSCKENTHTLMHKTNCGMSSCLCAGFVAPEGSLST